MAEQHLKCEKCGTILMWGTITCPKCGSHRIVTVSDSRLKPNGKTIFGRLTKRFGGESQTITVGGREFGPIGDRRLRLAAAHVSQQIDKRFQKSVAKGSVILDAGQGTFFIKLITKRGSDSNQYRQITEYVNTLLDYELLYQNFLNDLILLIGEYDPVGKPEGFMGNAQSEARVIGEKIDKQFGLPGMQYVCSFFGELWPHTGLMRSLEVAWNGIGDWRG